MYLIYIYPDYIFISFFLRNLEHGEAWVGSKPLKRLFLRLGMVYVFGQEP